MDIAALIFAPLLLALIYCWSRVNRLPAIVRLGLPVALLAILFVALLGYTPAVQEAITTRTPLVRSIEGLPLAFHLDGLSLLFGLIITCIGAMIALYGGASLEQDAYRRGVRGVLALVGVLLALVLIDHAISFFAVWMIMMWPRSYQPERAAKVPGLDSRWHRWEALRS
jgi:NADH:ubiquinone oxidoreductase subunit 5 (subunit L)/multisubunit Na+/H+ antiporter MnhA subunit